MDSICFKLRPRLHLGVGTKERKPLRITPSGRLNSLSFLRRHFQSDWFKIPRVWIEIGKKKEEKKVKIEWRRTYLHILLLSPVITR